MQWLIHGSLNPAVGEALRRHKQTVHTTADLSLPPDASLLDIIKAAQEKQWEIVTNDGALAQLPYEQAHPFPRTIVYLQLEGGDVEQDDAIDRLFTRYKRLSPRRLYTVTATRVKIRQLPGGQ